jgi:nucleoside-diphosphate-sugar epimerase
LLALGASSSARGVYILPAQPAETTRAVIARFGRALGREIAIARLPTWVLRAVGLFDSMVREVAEMTYQWEQPFVVDDSRFRTELGLGPTPWDDAIAETLAWAKPTYAPALAA